MSCPAEAFYLRPTQAVARDLVGMVLVRIIKNGGKTFRLAGRIVETEAYGFDDDPASHACMGPTPRNSVMFGEVGRAYVYFTYGNHYCVNVSARASKTKAGAVLIRAIEPTEGAGLMKQFRPVDDAILLTSGPGRLTQAFKITFAQNGLDMTNQDSEIHIESGKKPERVVAATRVGISRAAYREWRFLDPSSPYVSRKALIKAL